MTFCNATKEYYAHWTDIDPAVIGSQPFITACSAKRDVRQAGYSLPFHLYCLITPKTVVISHSARLAGNIDRAIENWKKSTTLSQVVDTLRTIFKADIRHSIKFAFASLPQDIETSEAVQLTREDFPHYKSFFEK